MAHKKQHDENKGKHIDRIVESGVCSKHKAALGEACWNIATKQGFMRGVCDRRARAAGANGDLELSTKKEYAR